MYVNNIKRVIDIAFGLITLPFLLMVIIIFGILIKLDDRGPIFYTSDRLGKNKSVFKMIKLRSMKVDAKDIRNTDGSTFTGNSDNRVTKVGKVIRKTSVDELPQFINVLKGDMSLVGPRPDTVQALEIYNDEQVRKLNVKPGITGYNQAFYRNSIPQDEKFNNDVYYVDNVSFLLDLRIIVVTILNVLKRKNINKD